MRLFVIKDLLRNDYHGHPFFAENEQVAKRSWNAFCESVQTQQYIDIDDFAIIELELRELDEVDYEEV